MRPRFRSWATLLGVALLLRVIFALLVVWDYPLVSDANEYSNQAVRFLDEFPGDTQYYWPPGTSYVLALFYEVFGAGRVAARVAMILLSVAAVATTVLLARRVLRDERAAWLSGWVLALLPSAIFMPAQPFSFDVTLLGVTLCVLLVLVAYDRRQARWLPLAGLSLGLAVAARPGAVTVLAALVPAALVVARRWWRAGERSLVGALAAGSAAFAVCLALAPLPAVLHHHDIGDGLTVSVNNEGNLLLGNNPYTPHYKTWHLGQHEFDDFEPDAAEYLNREFTAGGTLEQRESMRDEALDYMASNPDVTALRTINRARAFWGFDYTYSNSLRAEWEAPLVAAGAAGALEVGGWIVFGALVLTGLFLGRGLFRDARHWFLLAVVVAYQVPYLVAFAAGRWHLPVLALLAPFAAAGLLSLGSLRSAPARILGSKPLLAAIGVFLLLQAEYAFFLVTTSA